MERRSAERGGLSTTAPELADREPAPVHDAAFPDSIWTSGCDSWYLGKDGLAALWLFTPQAHRDMIASPHVDEWVQETAA